MKQIVRAFLFLLLFAAASNTTMADEKANIVKQGTVRGRIIDVTKQTLPGASIYIEKLTHRRDRATSTVSTPSPTSTRELIR